MANNSSGRTQPNHRTKPVRLRRRLIVLCSFLALATLLGLHHAVFRLAPANPATTPSTTRSIPPQSPHQNLAAQLTQIFHGASAPVTTRKQQLPRSTSSQFAAVRRPATTWNADQARDLARLHWQSGKQVIARARAEKGTVQFLDGWRLENEATKLKGSWSREETTAWNLLAKNHKLFLVDDPESEWVLDRSDKDHLGYTHVHFTQSFDGLEVWPSSLSVQINPAGHAQQVNAAYAPSPDDLNLTPTIEPVAALEIAKRHLQTLTQPITQQPQIEAQHLLIYAPLHTDARLAHSLNLHHGPGTDWRVMVDAHNGDVLNVMNQVCTAAVQGSGVDAGGNPQTLELWEEGGQYGLINTKKSMHDPQRSNPPRLDTTVGGILVFDAQNVSPHENPQAFNPLLVSSTSSNSGFGPNAVSAATNLALVYDYYEARHQRISIDGQGGNIVGIINIPINNAYWQNDVISFGNKDAWAHALDFAGHEMTHGIIEKSAGLIYENQPGALNEAFADILGESVEAFHHNGTPDWKLGTLLSTPLRDMQEPGRLEIAPGRRYPSRMSEFIAPTDPFLDNLQGRDNGGVHLNSSIINHAFYLLAEGLPDPLGLASAERIFYRALTTKLQKQSQFLDCRIACIQSAEELFGAGSTEARQTAAAFNAVEIFDQVRPPAPTPVPSVTGEDSTLFTFINPQDGMTYLARRESGQGDEASGILLVDTPVAPGKRPVVSRDGSVALFVTAAFSVAVIDTLTGQGEIVGEPGSVWSVGLSPTGRYLGMVLAENDQPEDVIRVLDLETDQTEEYSLKAPALDGGATDTILFADVLNFTPNGQTIYYDALNRIKFSDGTQIDSWSIYALDRQTGNTISVVPPIPGLSIGNPSLGRSFVNHLVFEAQDATTAQSHIFTQDLNTGDQTEVAVIQGTAGLAFPDFFGDDRAVLYSDYAFDDFGFLTASGLSRQPLATDGLTPEGSASVWLLGTTGGPTIGTIYRRGVYEGISTIEVTATTTEVNESNETAQFVLQRSQPTSDPLAVQFVLTGTATPEEDYRPVSLTANFDSDQSELVIPIALINDNTFENDENLTLTLNRANQYDLGAKSRATLTIKDDDADTSSGFTLWADQQGVGSADEDFDGDQLSNLVEYALGLDPKSKNSNSILRPGLTAINGQQHLTITVPRTSRRTDIAYGFENSTDLANWTSADAIVTVTSDTESDLKVRLNAPVNTGTHRFFRLSISRKP